MDVSDPSSLSTIYGVPDILGLGFQCKYFALSVNWVGTHVDIVHVQHVHVSAN